MIGTKSYGKRFGTISPSFNFFRAKKAFGPKKFVKMKESVCLLHFISSCCDGGTFRPRRH